MEVGLQTDADQRISVSKPEVQVDRALDVVARLHVDHDEHRPVFTGRRLQDPFSLRVHKGHGRIVRLDHRPLGVRGKPVVRRPDRDGIPRPAVERLRLLA